MAAVNAKTRWGGERTASDSSSKCRVVQVARGIEVAGRMTNEVPMDE